MKIYLLLAFCCSPTVFAIGQSLSQTRTTNRIIINHKRQDETMVYPNPTMQKTTIAYTATETTTTLIQLYSMQGTLLWTHSGAKVLKGLLYQQLLDLSGLSIGSYVYKLTNGTKVQKGIITKTE